MMRVEIIAVGSEMLTPSRMDTNSLFVTRRFNELGLGVARKAVVEDSEEEIRLELSAALSRSDLVVLVGGLGPTSDDLTREAVAGALGRDLFRDETLVKRLRERYGRAGLDLGENSLRQAMVPEDALVIENRNGTAPGLFLEEGGKLIFLLPGPPIELEPMMDEVVALVRRQGTQSVPPFRSLKVASEAESALDLRIESIYGSYPHVKTTILSSPGVIELYFNWAGDPEDPKSQVQLDELVARVRTELKHSVFTEGEESLEEVVGRILTDKALTLSVAESCTGGLIGKILTDVPGSSTYFRGGVVCYSNEMKADLLGVNETVLETHGAVSQEVAHQMAEGVRVVSRSDFGLSVTGVAGPGGGSNEKPVGLIFMGLSTLGGTEVKRLNLSPPRGTIRMRAARYALDWLRRELTKNS
jgi:nicotinamide-nucleotide amidase